MIDCVVVVRLRSGDEILAILNGELDGVVKLEHPYYVKFNPMTNNIAMMPYCALSDEKYFEFRRDNIEFLVTANQDISAKFLRMVDAYELAQTEKVKDFLAAEEQVDELDARLNEKNFIEGNNTKH